MKSADEQDLVRAVKKHWRGAFHAVPDRTDYDDRTRVIARLRIFFLIMSPSWVPMKECNSSKLQIASPAFPSYSNAPYVLRRSTHSVFSETTKRPPQIRLFPVAIGSLSWPYVGETALSSWWLKIRVALRSVQLFTLLERRNFRYRDLSAFPINSR